MSNESYPGSAQFTLPANILDGEYQVVISTDATRLIPERDGENNNVEASKDTINWTLGKKEEESAIILIE